MLTPEELNKRADEIVEMFRPICSGLDDNGNGGIKYNDAIRVIRMTKCAILHVEKQIDLLSFIWQEVALIEARSCNITKGLIEEHQQILQNLKERIK